MFVQTGGCSHFRVWRCEFLCYVLSTGVVGWTRSTNIRLGGYVLLGSISFQGFPLLIQSIGVEHCRQWSQDYARHNVRIVCLLNVFLLSPRLNSSSISDRSHGLRLPNTRLSIKHWLAKLGCGLNTGLCRKLKLGDNVSRVMWLLTNPRVRCQSGNYSSFDSVETKT